MVDRDGVLTVSIPSQRWCRIKQHVKHGRALRVATVINDPVEVGVRKRLQHPPQLVAITKAVNRPTPHAHRVAQQCNPQTRLFQRVCPPSTIEDHRAPGLRFGDHLVLGPLGALTPSTTAADGLTNASLRAAVAHRTGMPHTSRQTSHDRNRLPTNGPIRRIPHTNRYQVTDDGRRLATVYTPT